MGYERISGVTLPVTTFSARQKVSKPVSLLTRKRATVGKPEVWKTAQVGRSLPPPSRRVIAATVSPKPAPNSATRPTKTPIETKKLILQSKPGGGTTYSGVMVGPPPPQETAAKDPTVAYSAAWTPEGPTLEALEFERGVAEGLATTTPEAPQAQESPKKGVSGKTVAMLIGGGILAYYLVKK